jgi:hypothetical protein
MRLGLVAVFSCMAAGAAATPLSGTVGSQPAFAVPFANVMLLVSADSVFAADLADSLGRWALEAPPGGAVLRVEALGFETREQEVEAERGGCMAGIHVRLVPDRAFHGLGGPIRIVLSQSGVVREAQTGEPLAGVLVLAWETMDETRALRAATPTTELITDESGRYLVEYSSFSTLVAWKPGYDWQVLDLAPRECGGSPDRVADLLLVRKERPSN